MAALYGGADEFDALVYGHHHPGTSQYLESNIQKVAQQFSNFGNAVTDAGKLFYESAKNLYQRFNDSDAVRAAHAAMSKIRMTYQPDCIRPLRSLHDLQNAPLTMQRYMMAEPVTRALYNQQLCDGYSETYIDIQPGAILDNHYDYRRVMEGLVTECTENPEQDKVTFYMDDLINGDRELTLSEQLDITSTWELMRAFVKEGKEDPVSSTGGFL